MLRVIKLMAKIRTKYVCQSCGYETSKWMGKCPECMKWNSFVEEIEEKKTKKEVEANNVKCFAVQGDVTNFKDCEQFVKQIVEEFGNIDVLVNNAGITKDTLLICFLFTFIMQIALLIISHHMISISQIILNIIGGLMGIFISNNFISKTNLRFC